MPADVQGQKEAVLKLLNKRMPPLRIAADGVISASGGEVAPQVVVRSQEFRHAAAGQHLGDEAHGVRISVVPGAGGEMASLRCKIGNRWRELLYRALDYRSTPPDGWDGRAPLLWPAVGRSFTAEQIARWRKTGRKPGGCRAALGGRVRAFPIHGFARHCVWTLDSCGCDGHSARATCSLKSSAETRKLYPFDFRLRVTHKLAGGKITCRYEVTAGANVGPMPFAIGNHISFRVPLAGRGRYEDSTIRTPACRNYLLTELGLLSGRTKRVNLSQPANLTEAIYGDTFLGGYTRRNGWVELCDPAGITVRVSHAETPIRPKPVARKQHRAANRERILGSGHRLLTSEQDIAANRQGILGIGDQLSMPGT